MKTFIELLSTFVRLDQLAHHCEAARNVFGAFGRLGTKSRLGSLGHA